VLVFFALGSARRIVAIPAIVRCPLDRKNQRRRYAAVLDPRSVGASRMVSDVTLRRLFGTALRYNRTAVS